MPAPLLLLAEHACDADRDGTCAQCGCPIRAGQRVARIIGGGWAHVAPCITGLIPPRR